MLEVSIKERSLRNCLIWQNIHSLHLQNKHEVLSQQYHDSQRTVEKLREEIREFKDKSQQLKPVSV